MSSEGEAGTVDAGGGEGTEAGGAPAPDFGAVMGRLDKLSSDFESFRGGVEQRLQPVPEPEPEPEPEGGFDLEEYLRSLEPGQIQEDGTVSLEGLLQMTERQVEERLAAERSQQQQERLAERQEREMLQLETKYPRLADQEVADAVAEFAIDAAVQMSEGTGINPAILASEPRFVERMYLAYEAQRAQAEGRAPGSDQGVVLERSSGGGPVGRQQSSSDDDGDRIVAISQRNKFRV